MEQQVTRKGYKQTDLGEIPDDWGVRPLEELLAHRPKYGINAAAVPLTGKLPVYIRITDINDEGYFKPTEKVGVDNPLSDDYKLEGGDIVVARTGASVGKSYLYRKEDGELIYAGFLIKLSPGKQLSSSYLFQYFKTEAYWNWVTVMSMRSGQPGINGKEYGHQLIPVPSLDEQTAIANALSDTDALITFLEKLINKKRAIKTATMQQLLTGKTRLPGFDKYPNGKSKGTKQTELGEIPEDWEPVLLGDIGAFYKGSGVNRDEASSGELPCVRYGEIYTKHHDVLRSFHSFISPSVAERARRISKGDLLFAGSGETKEEIGKCVAFIDDIEAYAGGDIVILKVTKGDSRFLGYLLNSPRVVKQKSSFGQGDAVVHVSASALAGVRIAVPTDPQEQERIANVLLDLDSEIDALVRRVEKTKQIKQGMMQELLTGRTRLV